MKQIEIYTDGACSGNPGPGGWCAILKYRDNIKQLDGGSEYTTNNRMELTAVISGLSKLKYPCKVNIYTDSQYIVNSINKSWVWNWEKNKFKKPNGRYVPNSDLWIKLIALIRYHKCNFIWVKGHNGDETNELCDTVAHRIALSYRNKQ